MKSILGTWTDGLSNTHGVTSLHTNLTWVADRLGWYGFLHMIISSLLLLPSGQEVTTLLVVVQFWSYGDGHLWALQRSVNCLECLMKCLVSHLPHLFPIFLFFLGCLCQKLLKPKFYFRWSQNESLFPAIPTFLLHPPRQRKLIPSALLLTPSITVDRYSGVWKFTSHPKVLRFEYLLLCFGNLLAICINISSL